MLNSEIPAPGKETVGSWNTRTHASVITSNNVVYVASQQVRCGRIYSYNIVPYAFLLSYWKILLITVKREALSLETATLYNVINLSVEKERKPNN